MLFPSFLSMDIGSHSVKVLQVKKTGSRLTVQKALTFPTPEGAVQDGRITDVKRLAEELKQRLKTAGMKAGDMIASVSGTSVITRDVVLPKAKKSELDRIIDMNSTEYIPVNMDGYILDYKVLKEIKLEAGGQYRVLLVAVPKQVVEGYVDLASECGLNMLSIDFSGNSIYKLVKREMEAGSREDKLKNKTAAVIDIGALTTTITIVSEGVLEFNRLLLYGSSNIDMMISNKLFADLEQAESIKINKGQLIDLDDEEYETEKAMISDSIKSVLINYIDDIGRFFEYYNSRRMGNKIDIIYTIGAGCQIKGLEEYFEKAFNIKTERLSQVKSITSSKGSEFDKDSISFQVCMGAALN